MKISFLINSLASGGAERIAVILLNYLSKLGYNLSVYMLENEKFYELDPQIKCYPLSLFTQNTSKAKRFLFLPKLLLKYYQEVKFKNPDLLLSFLELSNFISIIVGRLLKKKTLISVRINPLYMYSGRSIYAILHRTFIRKLYPLANIVVAVSKGVRKTLIDHFGIPPQKVQVIYNPHDLKLYQTLAREPLLPDEERIFKGRFVFINVGRLSLQKGHSYLIRSFAKVVRKYPQAALMLVGDGELRESLEKLVAQLDLKDKVFFMGRRKNPFNLMARAHCFVLSSLCEGFPNVLIEALALNLPVVATDCPSGPREILAPELELDSSISYPYFGPYGILLPTFPEEGILFHVMCDVIDNYSKLKDLYKKGVNQAKNFMLDKIIEKWMDVLDENKL